MKLINVIYKLRNIIKNYRKYRYDIVYDNQFIDIIEQLIKQLLERAHQYRPMTHLLLELYTSMTLMPYGLITYYEVEQIIRNIKLKNKKIVNEFLTMINDYMYCDMELTEEQKDKMNYIINKNFIR